jgi:hypothetical protein
MSPTVWLGSWSSVEDLARDFGDYDKPEKDVFKDLDDATLLYAWYGQGSYDGDSEVLYVKEGVLYRNNAGHCSCNGLEGLWSPSQTSWEELAEKEATRKSFSDYTDDEDRKAFTLRSLIRERGFDLPMLEAEKTFATAS